MTIVYQNKIYKVKNKSNKSIEILAHNEMNAGKIAVNVKHARNTANLKITEVSDRFSAIERSQLDALEEGWLVVALGKGYKTFNG